jgi:hypothetical protein
MTTSDTTFLPLTYPSHYSRRKVAETLNSRHIFGYKEFIGNYFLKETTTILIKNAIRLCRSSGLPIINANVLKYNPTLQCYRSYVQLPFQNKTRVSFLFKKCAYWWTAASFLYSNMSPG